MIGGCQLIDLSNIRIRTNQHDVYYDTLYNYYDVIINTRKLLVLSGIRNDYNVPYNNIVVNYSVNYLSTSIDDVFVLGTTIKNVEIYGYHYDITFFNNKKCLFSRRL